LSLYEKQSSRNDELPSRLHEAYWGGHRTREKSAEIGDANEYGHHLRSLFYAPNDEDTGQIGGEELNVPKYWKFSVYIAKAWERTLGRGRNAQDSEDCHAHFDGNESR